METMLDRLNAEIAAHRDYLDRTLQSCDAYLFTYDKPTPDEVAVPSLDVEQWPGRVAMIREMRDIVRGHLGLTGLEGMCHRLAEAGGQKQQKIAKGRSIVEAALLDQKGWRARATKWLDETGPEGGEA